jgi:hypothetical protein
MPTTCDKPPEEPSTRPCPTVPGPVRSLRATRGATRLCQHHVTTDPDLAAGIDAWPNLPQAMRAGIVAMVKAAWGAG